MNTPNQNLAETLSSGKTVGSGRYILNKPIGEQSNAWLGHDELDNKPVVLTFPPAELCQDPRALEELRNQIAIVKDLSHPNVANIYDLYETEGEDIFICSEYVEGMNLRALQQMQPGKVFNWTFLSPLLKQIYAALQYVHENKLVQGALKPSALMLDRSGQVKLLDAGIAGLLNNPLYAGPPKAGAGGLLPYLSPQQIDGNPPSVTDDVYSLGVTIYEFLTNTPPFHTGDILPQIRSTPAQPLDQRLAQMRIINPIPPIVNSMVMACLSKDSTARPQDIETLAKSLEIAELAPQEAPKPAPAARPAPAPAPASAAPVAAAAPAAAPSRPAAPAPEKKKPTMAIAAVVVVLLAAAGVGAFMFLKKDGASEPSTQPPVANNNAQPDAKPAEPNAEAGLRAEIERAKQGQPTAPSTSSGKSGTAVIESPLTPDEEALLRRRVKEAVELGELARRSGGGRPSPAVNTPTTAAPVTPTANAVAGTPASAPGDYVSLFNGEDLTNWKGDPNFWSVSQGAITAQTPANAPANVNTCLIWQGGTVGDFELRFKFKFKMVKANEAVSAGVVYRGKRRGEWDVWGYECKLSLKGENIGGIHSRERMGLMSFFQKNLVRAGDAGQDKLEPLGDIMRQEDAYKLVKREDWNECVITARGKELTHEINGRVVAQLIDENDKKRANSGLLALELNTGARPAAYVQFKDLQMKRLSR